MASTICTYEKSRSVSIGGLVAEEEQFMPQPKADETEPNPTTHYTSTGMPRHI